MINKTFRLFISSTFNDFILERNILNDEIFPIIDDFCQQHGYNFQLIDLRWGVTNESALNQNTLAICLDEVKRCRNLSPKPNFLIMAGERYGWIPLPAKISKDNFCKILSVASPEETQIITEWYILDENEIGGEYYLKMRSGKYVNDEVWSQTESLIYTALLKCVSTKLDMSPEQVRVITSSATEQEIFEGLLDYKGISDNTIAIFRNDYPERDENQARIKKLKERILKKLGDDGCEENILHLEWNSSYYKNFKEKIIEILLKNISSEIDRLTKDELTKKRDDELDQILSSAEVVFDRPEARLKILKYLDSDSNKPLFLYGDSGSGKTTLLAQLIKNDTRSCFYAFYGWGENHYSLSSAIMDIINAINKHYHITNRFDVNETNLSESLFSALWSIPKEERAIIVIDGFESFHDINDIKERVIPYTLPSNIKFIISSANQNIVDSFAENATQTLKLDWFDKESSKEYFEVLLKQKNRCIASATQENKVWRAIENGTTPLQLKIMCDECSTWHSADNAVELADSVELLALRHLSNTYEKYGHNKDLVLYALALIAASPYGVTEDELQSLLLSFPPVRKYFVSEDRHNHKLDKLPFVIWSRLFYDLKGCLTLSRNKGFIVVKFAHQIFYRIFFTSFKTYYDEAVDTLISYYAKQNDYINARKMPNVRKALSLAVLLKQSKKTEALAELLCQLSYVDSVIRTGRVHELISDLQFSITQVNDNVQRLRLKQIYFCIQKNRSMLNCYQNEFYTCLDRSFKADNNSILQIEDNCINDTSLYFPYSNDSKICWSDDETRYAVYINSYVYICEEKTNTEICRIYLEPHNNAPSLAKQVLWLGKNRIGIITYDNTFLAYDLQNGLPSVFSVFEIGTDEYCIKYSSKNNCVFLRKNKKILSKNILTGEELFSIRLKSKYNFDFDVDDTNNTIAIKDTIKHIRLFNASTGSFIKSQYINCDCFERFTQAGGGAIHQIDSARWLSYRSISLFDKFAIYDSSKNTRTYLHPPFGHKIKKMLVGKNFLVLAYSDVLILINLVECFKMKWMPVFGIKDVSWKKTDSTFSVLGDAGFCVFSTDEFKEFPAEFNNCINLKKNLFSSVFLITDYLVAPLVNVMTPLKILGNIHNILDYEFAFSFVNSSVKINDLQFTQKPSSTASIVVKANDGKVAVAYEEENVIIVYNQERKPILQIDKLKLAICNDILKICFSADSKNLLIWRNNNVIVIDICRGRSKLDLSIEGRPAFDIDFTKDSKSIKLLLCNGKEYCCSISGKTTSLPRNLVSETNLDDYAGPYSYYRSSDGKLKAYCYLNLSKFDLEIAPHHWFKKTKLYHGRKNWLYFKNGDFFLNGSKTQKFSHEFYDFNKCLQAETLNESDPIRYYLREKNDLFSELFEFEDNFLVLVSRLLNSVIVFNTEQMSVLTAYKINGNIIGHSLSCDKTHLHITIDREPYELTLRLNLSKQSSENP